MNASYFFLEIYFNYNVQKVLCHAQIIIVYFVHFNFINVIKPDEYIFKSPISLLQFISWPNFLLCIITFTMIEGVINLSFSFFRI